MSAVMMTEQDVFERAQAVLANPAAALAKVMDEYPMLNAGGMGRGYKVSDEDLERYRRDLGRSLADFVEAVKWCSMAMAPFRCFIYNSNKQSVTSYGQKHDMERETGYYVTNGTYIAAMLALGFNVTSDYNPHFNAKMRSEKARGRQGDGS